MLGGGVFSTQNKVLPGTYINFVAANRASATLAERGIAAIAMPFSWGPTNTVLELTQNDLLYKSRDLLGYEYSHDALKGLRDLFCNAKKVFLYRLNHGATKATNTYADALYGGVRGNDLSIVIEDAGESRFNVHTYLGTQLVDSQNVAKASDLKANKFVTFKSGASLQATAKTPLTSGTDGTVTSADWQKAIEKLEPLAFNTFGAPTNEEEIKKLVVEWTKNMREKRGVKFQTVVYQYSKADYEGVISVENTAVESTSQAGMARVGEARVAVEEFGAVYWVTGAQAGCKVEKSLTNIPYSGEYALKLDYKQEELEQMILDGKFAFHRVGDQVRVLTDINSLTTHTEERTEVFSKNQTIRVLDQIANDVAAIFNDRFLGKIPNDQAGRESFWSQLVSHHQQLLQLRAIQNFVPEDIVVLQGDSIDSVSVIDSIQPVCAMEKLYMNVRVGSFENKE